MQILKKVSPSLCEPTNMILLYYNLCGKRAYLVKKSRVWCACITAYTLMSLNLETKSKFHYNFTKIIYKILKMPFLIILKQLLSVIDIVYGLLDGRGVIIPHCAQTTLQQRCSGNKFQNWRFHASHKYTKVKSHSEVAVLI